MSANKYPSNEMLITQLRRLGHDSDLLNRLAEDEKRLSLDEREELQALQLWAVRASERIALLALSEGAL